MTCILTLPLGRYDTYQDSSGVFAITTHSFEVSSTQLAVVLPIPQGTYLSPGSFITITIVNGTVRSPVEAASSPVAVSPVEGVLQVSVPDHLANIAVGFTQESLIVSVNES